MKYAPKIFLAVALVTTLGLKLAVYGRGYGATFLSLAEHYRAQVLHSI
jgi:hypothetical protein